ncbi:hypothetical protein [uncultured Treponema sp.]|uniref:hypothetical protein n=1 Tax=uncultured Treponema sp. TaxID=162155 RepID=UPI0025F05E4B|nr:hypothetical protein [uncultured Treponema sp.]
MQNGDVIRVGDTFIPAGSSGRFWSIDGSICDNGVTFTLIRANLTLFDDGAAVSEEAEDGEYYVFKVGTGGYQLEYSRLHVTATSDGIVVSNVNIGSIWNSCAVAVHEPD